MFCLRQPGTGVIREGGGGMEVHSIYAQKLAHARLRDKKRRESDYKACD